MAAASAEPTTSQEIASSEPETSILSSESSLDELEKADSVFKDAEIKQKVEDLLSQWLNPSQIAMVMTWLGYLATIIALACKLKSLNSKNQLTLDNVKKAILDSLGDKVTDSVKAEIEKYFGKLNDASDKTQSFIQEFAKVIALAQVGDKKGVLDCIANMSVISKETVEEIKAEVDKKEKAEEAKKEETIAKLDKIGEDGTSV